MTSNAFRDQPSSTRSTPTSDAQRQSAAFRGASRAFSQAPYAPKPLPSTYTGTNEAFAAASTVGTGGRRHDEKPAEGSPPYGQKRGGPSIRSSPRSGVLEVQGTTRQSSLSRERSPSHTAARLAASETPPSLERSSNSRRHSYLQTIDDGANAVIAAQYPGYEIPSGETTSLVRLFESKQNPKTPGPVTTSVRYVNKPPLIIASPTPIRPVKRSRSSTTVPLRTFPSTAVGKEAPSNATKTSHAGALAAAANLAITSGGANEHKATKVSSSYVPEPPAPRRRDKGPSPDGIRTSISYLEGSLSGLPQAPSIDLTEKFVNEAGADFQAEPGGGEGAPSIPIHISASPSRQPSFTARPSLLSARSFDKSNQLSSPSRPSRTTTRSSDSYIPKLTVDSLANAMVASSLASSRAPSPIKPPPVPPPRRHGKPYSLFHHHQSQEEISRTPSPAKGMRQTMREPYKSGDEVDFKMKKGHMVRKHPNKHHEGDRKRYRNQVTERERKRYEGVWAANRGLLLESEPDSKDAVLNVVVRDIWSRSRLPDDVLEEVWDLVDTRGDDKLGREEFVVGLWLIDSRLKGNKLPSKVSESMWASVRRLSGIKVQHHLRR